MKEHEPKSPCAMRLGKPKERLLDLFTIGGRFGLVMPTRLAKTKEGAGPPGADAALIAGGFGHLFFLRWPHHFFAKASFKISASN